MTAPATALDPAHYVPHEGAAVLLDRVWADGERITRASATVRAPTPFTDAAGWPAWLTIELMAQVVAAGAGLREARPGGRPRLGLLLGVRDYRCDRGEFAGGATLGFEAVESTRDERGMGVFDCTMTADGARAASAILSVYLPDSVEDYLRSVEP